MKRTLGVCYYPEHWPEEQWAEDAARMAGLGLTWVRIGEFAWGRIGTKGQGRAVSFACADEAARFARQLADEYQAAVEPDGVLRRWQLLGARCG